MTALSSQFQAFMGMLDDIMVFDAEQYLMGYRYLVDGIILVAVVGESIAKIAITDGGDHVKVTVNDLFVLKFTIEDIPYAHLEAPRFNQILRTEIFPYLGV